MNRAYISTAHFRAPYRGATLQGLSGSHDEILHFPKAGRSYYSTAHYRSPYDDGFFQDNNLFGVPSEQSKKLVIALAVVGIVAYATASTMRSSRRRG